MCLWSHVVWYWFPLAKRKSLCPLDSPSIWHQNRVTSHEVKRPAEVSHPGTAESNYFEWRASDCPSGTAPLRSGSWFSGPLHQLGQISFAVLRGRKPLMSLRRCVTVRYTTRPTVPSLWLTALWWQRRPPYIIHSDYCPAPLLPLRRLRWFSAYKKRAEGMMKIDWAARRRKVDSRSLEKFLFFNRQGLSSGYGEVWPTSLPMMSDLG